MQCLLFLLLRVKDDVKITYFHSLWSKRYQPLRKIFNFTLEISRKLIKGGGRNKRGGGGGGWKKIRKLTIGRGRLFGTLEYT